MTAPEGAPSVAFVSSIDAWIALSVVGAAIVLGLVAGMLGIRATRRESNDLASTEREISEVLAKRTLRAGRPLPDDPSPDADDSSGAASAEST